ncbi:carbohydrate ABC transporter permease [Leifsonia poae]|uniref:carbohydrate ABC transporter permease n=1 Tax=Leifsonia poae TaxID=110933 RepID=UPI001CBC72A5|nr:sugar ABC transporter permease [Leifsonia poae]
MRLTRTTAWIFVIPALVLYLAFTVYPAISGIAISFTDRMGVVGGNFVGFDNYVQAFTDPAVLAALGNTLVFTVVTVVLQNVGALALAAWMQRHVRIRSFARVGTLVPSMMAFVAVGYIWTFIYSPLSGPLNVMLKAVGLGSLAKVWLGDPSTALLAIAVTNVWMYLGYSATIYLSGYLSIPETVLEAAQMDGARGWARFRSIEWPLLAPALTVSLTLSVIGSLRVFDLILVMTQGGPVNSTQSLSYVIYQESFSQLHFGYGTAIAVILLVLTVIVAFTLTTVLRRREVAW